MGYFWIPKGAALWPPEAFPYCDFCKLIMYFDNFTSTYKEGAALPPCFTVSTQ